MSLVWSICHWVLPCKTQKKKIRTHFKESIWITHTKEVCLTCVSLTNTTVASYWGSDFTTVFLFSRHNHFFGWVHDKPLLSFGFWRNQTTQWKQPISVLAQSFLLNLDPSGPQKHNFKSPVQLEEQLRKACLSWGTLGVRVSLPEPSRRVRAAGRTATGRAPGDAQINGAGFPTQSRVKVVCEAPKAAFLESTALDRSMNITTTKLLVISYRHYMITCLPFKHIINIQTMPRFSWSTLYICVHLCASESPGWGWVRA